MHLSTNSRVTIRSKGCGRSQFTFLNPNVLWIKYDVLNAEATAQNNYRYRIIYIYISWLQSYFIDIKQILNIAAVYFVHQSMDRMFC